MTKNLWDRDFYGYVEHGNREKSKKSETNY